MISMQPNQTLARDVSLYGNTTRAHKRGLEDDGIGDRQCLKTPLIASSSKSCLQQSGGAIATDMPSFEFWPSHRPRPTSSAASSICRSMDASTTPVVPPSHSAASARRASEISFDIPHVGPGNLSGSYQEAATTDLELQVDQSTVEKSWSPPATPFPLGAPVLPQPAPDPESHVFKPEPMLHLNGQAMQHLSILGRMRSKVAHALRRRISRRVTSGALSERAAEVLSTACLSKLAKPVSISLQRYCAAKRFFAEGQSCLSRLMLVEGRGALGLFIKDVTVVTTALANAVVRAAVLTEAAWVRQQQQQQLISEAEALVKEQQFQSQEAWPQVSFGDYLHVQVPRASDMPGLPTMSTSGKSKAIHVPGHAEAPSGTPSSSAPMRTTSFSFRSTTGDVGVVDPTALPSIAWPDSFLSLEPLGEADDPSGADQDAAAAASAAGPDLSVHAAGLDLESSLLGRSEGTSSAEGVHGVGGIESEGIRRDGSLVQFLLPSEERMPAVASLELVEPASSTVKSRKQGAFIISSADSPFSPQTLSSDAPLPDVPCGVEGQDEAPALRDQGKVGRKWVHEVVKSVGTVEKLLSGTPAMTGGEVVDTLDVALAGTFMAGMENVDWYEAVQEAYGLDPEELLEQQQSMIEGDADTGGDACYDTVEGFDAEQRGGRRGSEDEEREVMLVRRPSIWH
ncbi:hypothetical protein CEUSTIGMA_g3327.t1 [Chlamydomonas eustigma]|uniref:Uncharacterized protein n=1 Tax=Chlamydomonas eustigma TaxID=1157962 RepID=A0A250WYG0_9CHLO|nr:hypothetical protein CEUSTIGMA_g3327.t1 [Chlamydomonas eustigma]|eukprot:GAX75884.1 hypothetical protein CEUSTIGMA_g3327.t1 [Chlamydomonas eustigma]